MNAARPAEILRQLEQTGTTDGTLLARFVANGDAAAFAELVRRHGALVLGICQRLTGHRQDAEDAFQATFLVLVRRATTLRNDVRLASWLYGVAYRVAWRAQRTSNRRRRREIAVAVLTEPLAPAPASEMPELMPILDAELAALPAHYREAIVLCDLRGTSRAEAAVVLGVPEGTLSSRLASGRKKLAARLTRRGVSLAVVALPTALAELQARTTVSVELIATTCGTVSDFAANRTVPGPLAPLIEGGFVVRKTFVFVALVAIAVAGAVFAAAARDDLPPVDSTPSPVVTGRIEDAQPSKPAPEPKPGTTYADAPRITGGWDVPLTMPSHVIWASTGSRLAIGGTVYNQGQPPQHGYPAFVVTEYTGKPDPENLSRTRVPKNGSLVGFTTDGKQLITDRRESHLLSGIHQLVYWDPTKTERSGPGTQMKIGDGAKLRTVTFDGVDLHGYAFAPDGKTFRTLRYRQSLETPRTMDVIEIDTTTGRVGKPVMRVNGGAWKRPNSEHAFSPDGKRLAVAGPPDGMGPVSPEGTVRVYDLEKRVKSSEFTFPPEKVEWNDAGSSSLVMSFSPDGGRLAISDGVNRSFVINVQTGKPSAALEGSHVLSGGPSRSSFSPDGRLFACCGREIKLDKVVEGGKERMQLFRGNAFLTVWDTTTGRTLKTWSDWDGQAVIAFHPTRPLLAVAEPGSDGETRLGFWDFANEDAKK